MSSRELEIQKAVHRAVVETRRCQKCGKKTGTWSYLCQRCLDRQNQIDKARYIWQKALINGAVLKQPCVICGNPDTHGHHPDYGKPLEVIWLCSQHHGEEHRRLNDLENKRKENSMGTSTKPKQIPHRLKRVTPKREWYFISLKVPNSLFVAIDEKATADCRSRTSWILKLIHDALEKSIS
jgi:ribosomal protein S14